ncbi:hypothetical protein Tco_0188249, partial [Tanacetum coccineum]
VRGNDVAAYTQRFQELALMCTKFLDFAIELANDLMDQKLRTYAERQNENKRKADDSSRNNHQQQPHKKKNVARAYTAGPGEKKVYTGDLPVHQVQLPPHGTNVHLSAENARGMAMLPLIVGLIPTTTITITTRIKRLGHAMNVVTSGI